MKSIDASKKHAVTLTFLLDEDISPQELAQKIAGVCGGNVLQPGDAIRVDHAKIACVVTHEAMLPFIDVGLFGWQVAALAMASSRRPVPWEWRRALKEPKRPKLLRNTCK